MQLQELPDDIKAYWDKYFDHLPILKENVDNYAICNMYLIHKKKQFLLTTSKPSAIKDVMLTLAYLRILKPDLAIRPNKKNDDFTQYSFTFVFSEFTCEKLAEKIVEMIGSTPLLKIHSLIDDIVLFEDKITIHSLLSFF